MAINYVGVILTVAHITTHEPSQKDPRCSNPTWAGLVPNTEFGFRVIIVSLGYSTHEASRTFSWFSYPKLKHD